ncbi:polysaccharide deacetylase family protein [Murimonas intestini]|uniref:polysaccharide deacetylase family protein n=1 Tax=Murimonas intestini TaxID=1337051 RepID=UPI0011DD703A|nr:polysaccharide deacetylase family protein [Murimonas intestini]
MIKKIRSKILAALLCAGVVFTCAGCSRAALNAQIAESIGTLGQYENNEPVQTPQMKAQADLKALEDTKEAALTKVLQEAQALADVYDYEAAMEKLGEVAEEYKKDDRVVQAKIEYQQKMGEMEAYDGDIPHIYFKSLIVDTARAFDGDGNSALYNSSMTTVSEFNKMMEEMYKKGYVLIDIHETVTEVEQEDGSVTYVRSTPMVPEGKKPFVLSIDNVNYYEYMENDGFAKRLVLDENGDVKNLYVDAGGNELIGNYDIVPILDDFIKQHPDFSLRGARGIVGVTGYEGVFGYRVNDAQSSTYEADCEAVRKIADRLRKTGWQIASNTYNYSHLDELSFEEVKEDTDMWTDGVEDLVGESDILLYPYGEEVEYPSDKLDYLEKSGFVFLCGMWGDKEFLQANTGYVRQTRREFSGYALHYRAESMEDFFDPAQIIDPARPAFE